MGPNGAGKSTLASVLAGRADYEVTDGSVLFDGHDLLDMAPEVRAAEGIFLAFQYPVEIPGVSTTNFLKTAMNEIRKHRGQDPLDSLQFLKLMKEKMKLVNIDQSLLSRSLNEGFSGGEKKRNEILQMLRLLDYIVPDFVHVLYQGRIVKSGPKELALELEEKGYDWIKAEVTNSMINDE